jgi:hypothetical protein
MKTTENEISLEAKKALSGIQKGTILSVCGLLITLLFAKDLGILLAVTIGGLLFLLGVLIVNKSSSKYHKEKAQNAPLEAREGDSSAAHGFIGINIDDFKVFDPAVIYRAIKREPAVIVIKYSKATTEVLNLISIAYGAGHEVRLINDQSEISNVEWISSLPNHE